MSRSNLHITPQNRQAPLSCIKWRFEKHHYLAGYIATNMLYLSDLASSSFCLPRLSGHHLLNLLSESGLNNFKTITGIFWQAHLLAVEIAGDPEQGLTVLVTVWNPRHKHIYS